MTEARSRRRSPGRRIQRDSTGTSRPSAAAIHQSMITFSPPSTRRATLVMLSRRLSRVWRRNGVLDQTVAPISASRLLPNRAAAGALTST